MSNFGEILKEIGEFGWFQKRLVAALCFPSMFVAFDVIGQVFTGMSFPHHCNTDWILERGPNLTGERQRNLTLPVNKDGKFESCKMFTPVDLDLETIEAYGINTTTGCINGSDFEAPKGASSILTQVREAYLYPQRATHLTVPLNVFLTSCYLFKVILCYCSDKHEVVVTGYSKLAVICPLPTNVKLLIKKPAWRLMFEQNLNFDPWICKPLQTRFCH